MTWQAFETVHRVKTIIGQVFLYAIEAQLGHRVPDRLGSAYNRAKHIEERTRMMQAWADYLETIKGLKT